MTDKLPAPVTLTEKQARFVECIGRGMLMKDAYRLAYDSEVNDKQAGIRAAEVKRSKPVALALREILRSRHLQDMDSVGELMADTKQDQENARRRGSDAAVAAFARMRGNWLGIERQHLVFTAESLMSDEELIQRLAGDDPERVAAARSLLGAPEGFPQLGDTGFDEIVETKCAHDVHTSR